MLCVFFLTIRRRIAHIFFLQLQTFIFLKRERTRELFLQSGEGHNMKSYPYGEFYYVQFVIFLYQIYLKPLQGFFLQRYKESSYLFQKISPLSVMFLFNVFKTWQSQTRWKDHLCGPLIIHGFALTSTRMESQLFHHI